MATATSRLSTSHLHRCDVLRERIEDWIAAHGGTRSTAARDDMQRLFVKRALSVGRERGMKLWHSKTMSPEDCALSSLRILLREKSNTTKGRTYTGSNLRWILDIWEAALDELTRGTRPKLEVVPAPEPEDPETVGFGVRVFAPAKPEKSLGTRILEAYLKRNDDLIVNLAEEVDSAMSTA